MKIIIIKAERDGRFDKTINPNAFPDFEKWIVSSKEKIGYKGDSHLFCGYPKKKWEFVWVENRLFRRYDGEGHFMSCDEFSGKYPDVICECGNAAFDLEYGSCEMFARCTKCGREDSVYSG